MIKIVFKYHALYLLLLTLLLTSCLGERLRKPIHYSIHKKEINELFLTFDEMAKSGYFRLEKSMDKDKINVSYFLNSSQISKSIIKNADSLKIFCATINVDHAKIARTIQLLDKAKVIAISSTTNSIEIKHKSRIWSILAFSENDYGYVFYPDKYKSTQNMKASIYYSSQVQ